MTFVIPFRSLVAFCSLSLLLAGCAVTDQRSYERCIAGFTLFGTGAGAAASSGGSVMAGAAVGSAAALTFCRAPGLAEENATLEPPPVAQAAATMSSAAAASRVATADADGDGVADSRDRCPDTPAGAKVDVRGCPIVLVFDDRALNFAFDSAELPTNADSVVAPSVAFAREHPGARLLIVGHTDSVGSEAYNQRLSLQRAEALRKALMQAGVAADRMDVRGAGESRPVESNDTAAGRARNRRVVLSLIR